MNSAAAAAVCGWRHYTSVICLCQDNAKGKNCGFQQPSVQYLLIHVPTLVSAIGHSQLLDHGCGTAFRPSYDSLTLPFISSAGVKDVFVWLTEETPAPSDFLFVVWYTNAVTYLLTYLLKNIPPSLYIHQQLLRQEQAAVANDALSQRQTTVSYWRNMF